MPGDVLICFSKEIISGISAKLKSPPWYLYHSSPSFSILMGKIRGNDGGKKGNMIAIPKSVLLVFDTGTNFCSSTWRAAVFHIYTFLLKKENASGIFSVFPTVVIITPQVRESLWRFYNLLRLRIPIILSRTGFLATAWAWVPLCLPWGEQDQKLIHHLFPISFPSWQ